MISDDIKALRKQYKDDRAGYRVKKYAVLGMAMAFVLRLRANASDVAAFYKVAKKKLPKAMAENLGKSLTAALVGYVTCAKSKSAVKQAWKQARALDYLVDDQGVELKNIAKEISKRGGIEAIVKEAAQKRPRRKSGMAAALAALKAKSCTLETPVQQCAVSDEDDWEDISPAGEHQRGERMVTISMKASATEIAKMMALKPERRMEITCLRLDVSDSAVAEIQEVRSLKA